MTSQEPRSDRGVRFLMVAAGNIVVIAGLRQAGQLILPVLTAVFLAVVSFPVMAWLQRKKVPTPLAVLTTVDAAAGVVSVLGVVVGRSVTEFAQVAPQYQARFQDMANEILPGPRGLVCRPPSGRRLTTSTPRRSSI